mgnify:CR=1 FL=1
MEDKIRQRLITREALPFDFDQTVQRWYVPLAHEIAEHHDGGTLVIGIQGSQGSGKSTFALFLKHLLEDDHGLRTIEMSLDDFYLGHAERRKLATNVHPLFATRGVPGTHDVDLAMATIRDLKKQKEGQTTLIPRFDKSTDDRKPAAEWDRVSGPIDIVILEGWCIGASAQTTESLTRDLNILEEQEDADGTWRQAVNEALTHSYDKLFGMIDKLVVLAAPSFDCVYEWRWLQEKKLASKWQATNPNAPARLLDEPGLKRFISHYERLTLHCLDTLPAKADWLYHLNTDHNITRLIRRTDE